ncbi:hypothetical protein JCM18237_16440 [Halorubrum luteum]
MRNDKGQYSTPDDKSISSESEELLGLYLESLKQQKTGTAESTITTRRREVRYWLAFCEDNEIDPLKAETSDVRGYIQINNKDLADTTIGSYYRSVQSFYSIIQKDEVYDELELPKGHPCKDSDTIDIKETYSIHENVAEYRLQHTKAGSTPGDARETDGDVLALQPHDVEKLFDNVPGKTPETRLRNDIILRLSWYTACRSDELSRMRVGKIDWNECSIEIRGAKLNPKEHGGIINRKVYFPESFRFELKRWVERVRHAYSATVEPEEGRLLVTTRSGEMQPTHISNIIKQAAREAGIQRPLRPINPDTNEDVKEWFVTAHRIRRSAITHWVNDIDALDLHQVQRLAGHARIEQTMQYVEPDDDQLRRDYHRGME